MFILQNQFYTKEIKKNKSQNKKKHVQHAQVYALPRN